MNPLTSWINELSRKITVGVFSALGTKKETLDSFVTVSKQVENDQGNLTIDQWEVAADEAGKKVSQAFSIFKLILPIALIVAAIWGIGKLRQLYK